MISRNSRRPFGLKVVLRGTKSRVRKSSVMEEYILMTSSVWIENTSAKMDHSMLGIATKMKSTKKGRRT